MGGLYRLLNHSSGDVLKVAKDDNLWGAMHTAEGTSNKAAAKLIGGIPVIKEGPVDELMHDGGKYLEKNAEYIEESTMERFSEMSNPGTSLFIDYIEYMIKIYNHTEAVYVDGELL